MPTVVAQDIANRSLVVPPVDAEPWPSLGGLVCDWIEERLVHGPGDILGQPATLTDEYRIALWRLYEIHPRGHEYEGRRRFKRAAVSRRKGAAKTELDAWIALAELDPEAPVRFAGWDAYRDPVGRGVVDPYIPLVSTTEEQSDELVYGAARQILLHCQLGNHYDVGLERITPIDGTGTMISLASSPNARDGARTTFQVFDETHLFVSERLKRAHATMLRNIPKRRAADPWSLESTTMYEPGEESIAEETHAYAIAVALGEIEEPSLYYDHRQAAMTHDLATKSGLRAAIEEASGDALAWADVPAIAGQWKEPNADLAELCRYWLNQRRKGSGRWLSHERIEQLGAPRRRPRDGAEIVVAFDGSSRRDSTALVGCTVAERPHVFVIEAWERPKGKLGQDWRVPRREVDDALAKVVDTFQVVEIAPDPPGWHKEIEEWEELYEQVVRFETNQPSRMGPAADKFRQALTEGEVTHDGTEPMIRHLSNCRKAIRRGYEVPVKAADDSPDKIDIAIGAVVAHDRATWHKANRPARRTWKVA